MNFINRDQKKRVIYLDTRKEVEEIFRKLFTAFAIFAILATLFTVFSISNAEAVDCHDYLISPDMADYMNKQGSGQAFTEQDAD